MSNFAETLKGILTEGAKAVSGAAKNVASATRYKMSEMDSVSRRREAISELGEKVYGLFEAGVSLPEEIVPLVNEIRALDDGLDSLRTDRAAEKAAAASAAAAEKAARAQVRAEAKAAAKAAKAAEKAAAAEEAAPAAEEAPVLDFEPEIGEGLTYTGEAPTMEVEAAEEPEEDGEEIVPNIQ